MFKVLYIYAFYLLIYLFIYLFTLFVVQGNLIKSSPGNKKKQIINAILQVHQRFWILPFKQIIL